MTICIIENDEGKKFVQIGRNASSLEELAKQSEADGEKAVDFFKVEPAPNDPTRNSIQEGLEAFETLCCLNNDGGGSDLGGLIETMLLQTYQAGVKKGQAPK